MADTSGFSSENPIAAEKSQPIGHDILDSSSYHSAGPRDKRTNTAQSLSSKQKTSPANFERSRGALDEADPWEADWEVIEHLKQTSSFTKLPEHPLPQSPSPPPRTYRSFYTPQSPTKTSSVDEDQYLSSTRRLPRNVYTPPSPATTYRSSVDSENKPSGIRFSDRDNRPSGVRFSDRENRSFGTRFPHREYTGIELSTIDHRWGPLFDKDGNPTQRLGQFLRGLANHIIDDFYPKKSFVVTPTKMKAYYADYEISREPHPLLSIFTGAPNKALSTLYQDLACQHHLVQADTFAAPDVPGLTPAGFERWMTVQILAYPEEEAQRLEKVVLLMPINADGSIVDGKPERLPKQISRHLLPGREDRVTKETLNNAVDSLLEHVRASVHTDSISSPPLSRRRSSLNLDQDRPQAWKFAEPLARDRRLYKCTPSVSTESDVEQPIRIERDRQPYTAQPSSGKIYAGQDSKRWDAYLDSGSSRYHQYQEKVEAEDYYRGGRTTASLPSFPEEVPIPSKTSLRSGVKFDHGEPSPHPPTPIEFKRPNAGLDKFSLPFEVATGDETRLPRQAPPLAPNTIEPLPLAKPNVTVVDEGTSRLSILIKPGRLSGGFVQPFQDEEKLSGPDRFIKNPSMYTENISRLQEQIFELGKPALPTLESGGDIHVLLLPLSTSPLDPVLQSPSTDFDAVQPLVFNCLNMISAINESQIVLAREEFCDSTYNIIVVDPERSNVLQVVPIKTNTLQVLKNLLEEAVFYLSPSIDFLLLKESLEDLNEAVELVLRSLGLRISVPGLSELPLSQKLRQICSLASSTLSVLFFGLVSFVSSHLCFEENVFGQQVPTQLRIETSNCPIFMAPRQLLCLDGFLKQPVWTFSTVPINSASLERDESERYYLSIFLADVADLWGPLNIRYVDDSQEFVSEIAVRGGVIRSFGDVNHSIIPRVGEILCHWHGWMEASTDSCERTAPLSITKRLLIGAPDGETSYAPEVQIFQVSRACTCDRKRLYSDSYDAFELNTKVPSWSHSEKTAQVSGGAYVNLLYGHTWKFNAGWTLKDVIVGEWVDHIRDPTHMPKPFYLDYFVVLDVSRCTGNSRRISLWSLLKQEGLRRYLRRAIDINVCTDFDTLVQFFPRDASFADIWHSVSKQGQEVFKIVAKEVLGTLKSTGVGEDGYLQAWDITSLNRLDGRKIKPPWSSMIKDDSACATFAIITSQCVKYGAPSTPPDPRTSSDSTSAILCTTICITAQQSLDTCDPHVYTPPHSSEDDLVRPEWALADTTFEKWRVELSEDPPNPVNLGRVQLIKSARDQSGPDAAMQEIANRQSSRQSRHRKKHPENGAASGSSSRQVLHTNGVSAEISRQEFSPQRTPTQKRFLNGVSKVMNPLICHGSLDFKNGKGEHIGKLLLEPEHSIDLYAVKEGSAVTAKWEERKFGLLAAIKAKENVIDRRIAGWTEKQTTNSVLPWAISRVVELKMPAPFVVEQIRGGNLDAGHKVLQSYIR